MDLEIVKPDQNIFSGVIKAIHLPGSNGSFEILDDHAPLIATLKKGNIKVTTVSSDSKTFEVNGGVVEVNNNKIIVLAE